MSVDFGRRVAVLRAGRGVSVRFGVRTAVVCALLVVAAVAVGLIALSTGEFAVPLPEVVEALTGKDSASAPRGGTPDRIQAAGQGSRAVQLVVVQWRLPRVLLALLLGAALGLSGAIFQSLLRNPLGSPDVIGFNTGAYTGVLVAMVFVGRDYAVTATGALVGGLATAAVVYLFAYRRGVAGFRLIIVGIAVAAVLGSVNQWFIIRVNLQTAIAAAIWGQGSLNGLSWDQVPPVALALAVIVAALVALGPRLSLLELGPDAAAALGVRVEWTQLAYLGLGVALTAVATAAAGPVSFVALAAPQLAHRLARTAGIALVPSACVGAVLLVASDWVAQHAFAPTQLPVGVVTVSLGGLYFAWLLARQARR